MATTPTASRRRHGVDVIRSPDRAPGIYRDAYEDEDEDEDEEDHRVDEELPDSTAVNVNQDEGCDEEGGDRDEGCDEEGGDRDDGKPRAVSGPLRRSTRQRKKKLTKTAEAELDSARKRKTSGHLNAAATASAPESTSTVHGNGRQEEEKIGDSGTLGTASTGVRVYDDDSFDGRGDDGDNDVNGDEEQQGDPDDDDTPVTVAPVLVKTRLFKTDGTGTVLNPSNNT